MSTIKLESSTETRKQKRSIEQEGGSPSSLKKKIKVEPEPQPAPIIIDTTTNVDPQRPFRVSDLYAAFNNFGPVNGLKNVKEIICDKGAFNEYPKTKFTSDYAPETLPSFPLFVLFCFFTQETLDFLKNNIATFGPYATLKEHVGYFFRTFCFEKFRFDSESIFQTIKEFESKAILNDVLCPTRANTQDGGDTSSTHTDTGVRFTQEQIFFFIEKKLFQLEIRVICSRGSKTWFQNDDNEKLKQNLFPLHYRKSDNVSQLLAEKKINEILEIFETCYLTITEFHNQWKKDFASAPAKKKQANHLKELVHKDFCCVLRKQYSDCLPLLHDEITVEQSTKNLLRKTIVDLVLKTQPKTNHVDYSNTFRNLYKPQPNNKSSETLLQKLCEKIVKVGDFSNVKNTQSICDFLEKIPPDRTCFEFLLKHINGKKILLVGKMAQVWACQRVFQNLFECDSLDLFTKIFQWEPTAESKDKTPYKELQKFFLCYVATYGSRVHYNLLVENQLIWIANYFNKNLIPLFSLFFFIK